MPLRPVGGVRGQHLETGVGGWEDGGGPLSFQETFEVFAERGDGHLSLDACVEPLVGGLRALRAVRTPYGLRKGEKEGDNGTRPREPVVRQHRLGVQHLGAAQLREGWIIGRRRAEQRFIVYPHPR